MRPGYEHHLVQDHQLRDEGVPHGDTHPLNVLFPAARALCQHACLPAARAAGQCPFPSFILSALVSSRSLELIILQAVRFFFLHTDVWHYEFLYVLPITDFY